MILKCLVSFTLLVVTLAQEPIAPYIETDTSELLLINSDRYLPCNFKGPIEILKGKKFNTEIGIFRVTRPLPSPIKSDRKYSLEETTKFEGDLEQYLVTNGFDSKGYYWCVASFSVFGQVQYLATSQDVRVLTSARQDNKNIILGNGGKITIQRNKEFITELTNYKCYASKGCRFFIKTEKIVNDNWISLANEGNITVDPKTGKVYFIKPDFSHTKNTEFSIAIVLSPLGESSQLHTITADVIYDDNMFNSGSQDLKLYPDNPETFDSIYEGQYGYSMACIPNQRVTPEWTFNGRKITLSSTKNKDSNYAFDTNQWVLYIKQVKSDSSGEYKCRYQDRVKTYTLNLLKPVKIFSSASKQVDVRVGAHSVDLPCRAEGSGNIKVFWRKITHGSNIKVADINEKNSENSVTSPFRETLTESTTLICFAENVLMGLRFVDSISHTFYVIDNMSFIKPPQKEKLVLDGSGLLRVEVAQGNYFKRSCTWSKNGKALDKKSERYDMSIDYNNNRVACKLQIKEVSIEDGGDYVVTVDDGTKTLESNPIKVTIDGTPGPIPSDISKSSLANLWWILLVILFIIIVVVVIIIICLYLQRNKGDEYNIDKLERKQGLDPEKELRDEEFKHYQRAEEPRMSSKASLNSTVSLGEDDDNSLLEYGEPDASKFNEDGSFMGEYGNSRGHGRNDTEV